MHGVVLALALGLAWGIRCYPVTATGAWGQRWRRALAQLVTPPLFILMAAMAVIWMGPTGQMGDPISFWLARGVWLAAGAGLGYLGWQGGRTVRRLKQHPEVTVPGFGPVREIPSEVPFAAQMGFWHSQTVVATGLQQCLDAEHLTAVLWHERAHAQYRDTFWFFWLGWLRWCSRWLPQTPELWQELLLLRELRADRLAAQKVSPLVLAEALLQTAGWQASPVTVGASDRLTERIEALLADSPPPEASPIPWTIAFSLLPLLCIPFHF
ncbi:MAG TPA: Zn-dependent protease with chaperone function [Cyanobacteria bacterium UBA8156]|nr:Zn-dependent protease with chaperone function [Cyanobacteria bacterium UBA8156]